MSSKLPVFPVTYKIYKNEKEKKISGLEDPNFHLDSTTKRSTKKKKKNNDRSKRERTISQTLAFRRPLRAIRPSSLIFKRTAIAHISIAYTQTQITTESDGSYQQRGARNRWESNTYACPHVHARVKGTQVCLVCAQV